MFNFNLMDLPPAMEPDPLSSVFGPCGLYCGACFAYENGPIRTHAVALRENLGDFDIYANRFVTLLGEPVFEHYPVFKEFLAFLAGSHCAGCRDQLCPLFSGCRVRDCSASKGVLFCHACAEFPCDQTGFDDHLKHRWETINRKIRETGLENYYIAIKDILRY